MDELVHADCARWARAQAFSTAEATRIPLKPSDVTQPVRLDPESASRLVVSAETAYDCFLPGVALRQSTPGGEVRLRRFQAALRSTRTWDPYVEDVLRPFRSETVMLLAAVIRAGANSAVATLPLRGLVLSDPHVALRSLVVER
ncbi:MAG: hypothetical protein ABWZ26_09020 [Candidatus Nanopelagicales bacterium]